MELRCIREIVSIGCWLHEELYDHHRAVIFVFQPKTWTREVLMRHSPGAPETRLGTRRRPTKPDCFKNTQAVNSALPICSCNFLPGPPETDAGTSWDKSASFVQILFHTVDGNKNSPPGFLVITRDHVVGEVPG